MRRVIKVTYCIGIRKVSALLFIRLRDAEQAPRYIARRRKHVSRILKYDPTQILDKIWKRNGRTPQLEVVNEETCTADREAGNGIAGAGLVYAKTAMRARASGKEPLWQRDESFYSNVRTRGS